jgi:bacillithiol biosynthesis cysteine-adding enzyme BshC
MQLKKFPLADTLAFNSFFLDYIAQKESLKPYYNQFPSLDNFPQQIAAKSKTFSAAHRQVLETTLRRQYKEFKTSKAVEDNINSLRNEDTFTITTGHQLNIFTGPLYFIYKIVTVINACKALKEKYPNYNFVPVYWMASEDHDYDEIKYFKLFGKKYEWNTDQQGAVGRFSTKGLAELAIEVPGDSSIFLEAYSKSKTLSDAVRHYVNALFSREGVVVIDADDAALKNELIPVIREDVLNGVNKKCIDQTDKSLSLLGYKTQVFCRDINFFYLEESIRSRIERKGDRFSVVDTEISFSQPEIEDLISKHPERFSPNVILRPLYQEIILPNLAYVGGPAEVIYWLQLKCVFDLQGIPFPMLMPRNFAMIMDLETTRKFEKTGLELKDIFESKNYLFNDWVLKHSPRKLSVGVERSAVVSLFDELKKRAETVDKSLSAHVSAEAKRAVKSLESIERKFLRAEKRLHSDKLKQVEFVKDRLFPGGSLQERSENFLAFQLQNPDFIDELLKSFNAFDFQFHVLVEE